jgi:hypothetical protein
LNDAGDKNYDHGDWLNAGFLKTSMTAAELAATIKTIAAPTAGTAKLKLPVVPDGFTIGIKSSSNTEVIALDGSIHAPAQQTTVNLVLEVVRTSDNSKASTGSIPVVVDPARSLQPYTIDSTGELNRSGGIQAKVTVLPTPEAAAGPKQQVVVFQLMNGTTPVGIVAVKSDSIAAAKEFTAFFNVEDFESTKYTVRVLVLDRFDSDLTAPVSLADPVQMK